MGKGEKKHGKGRLDHYYRLAKEKGYRARASFKLLQINQKYGGFLQKSKVVIDLCAAPGSWCQVASQLCPVNSLIVGVDLSPIRPLPNVITFQEDITSDRCRAQLRQHLKTWKADVVLHDGAPNVGMAWVQDAYSQAELVLMSLKLATEFLAPNGIFVTKVFRSKDYNALLWVFNQLFNSVDATKPPASRNVSAEIFVICKGYKSPKKIDPRLLDAKSVFAEIEPPTPNYEAKVYNPEMKKRKREGYEEGDYTQFHSISVLDFVRSNDPISILGSKNTLTFTPSITNNEKDQEFDDDNKESNKDKEINDEKLLKLVKKLPETTPEIISCCSDLKVLGKKDFRSLLKWRILIREIIGLPTKKSEAEAEAKAKKNALQNNDDDDLDEEEKIDKELDDAQNKAKLRAKRERRKRNEMKQKTITRMQMGMTTAMDIGIDASQNDADMLFNLKQIKKAAIASAPNDSEIQEAKLKYLRKGKMNFEVNSIANDSSNAEFDPLLWDSVSVKKSNNNENSNSADEDYDEIDSADELEAELDLMYDDYKERKSQADSKYLAKLARQENDDEWSGFGVDKSQNDEDDDDDDDDDDVKLYKKSDLNEDSDSESESDLETYPSLSFKQKPIIQDGAKLSSSASMFFDQDAFKSIDEDLPIEDNDNSVKSDDEATLSGDEVIDEKPTGSDSEDDLEEIEIDVADDEIDNEEKDEEEMSRDPPIEIVSEEAMTLAHQIALGEVTKEDVIDSGFNRNSFKETEGLPDWFLEDERRHNKPIRPVTKEAALAIKEKVRELNARPIKKVTEAKMRKKMRAARRIEKLKKKSDMLMEDDNRSERDKAEAIQKMISRASRKELKSKPRKKLVVARGANKGLKGRPRGVKGKYKMVDGSLKKEMRAIKRKAAKRK